MNEKMTAVHALAESWASIDGRLDRYFSDRDGKTEYGHWEGYNHEAETMIKRLAKRGYAVVPIEPTLDMGLVGAGQVNRHMRVSGSPADFQAAMDSYRAMLSAAQEGES